MARVRCSGSSSWQETTGLHPEKSTELIQTLEELEAQLQTLIARIDEIRETFTTNRLAPPIDETLGRILEIQHEAKRKRVEAQQLKLSNLLNVARQSVEAITSTVTPEDPEIVQVFSSREFTVRDLLYLKNQQALLVNQIRILEPLAKEERISREGRILSLTKLIGIHEICENRRDLARKLDERIKKLSEEHQTNTSILRSCLNPNCTKKKNSRSRWMLCPSCNRGYCASCSSNMKLATNHAVCTSAPDSGSLNSAQSAATNDLELSESDNSLDL